MIKTSMLTTIRQRFLQSLRCFSSELPAVSISQGNTASMIGSTDMENLSDENNLLDSLPLKVFVKHPQKLLKKLVTQKQHNKAYQEFFPNYQDCSEISLSTMYHIPGSCQKVIFFGKKDLF